MIGGLRLPEMEKIGGGGSSKACILVQREKQEFKCPGPREAHPRKTFKKGGGMQESFSMRNKNGKHCIN